ncbi:MAG: polysulfide reductase NrfD [bacterium]|nr:polysulfide reductase NrfD [bacterium]
MSTAGAVTTTVVETDAVSWSRVKRYSVFFGFWLLVGVLVGLTGFIIGHHSLFNTSREIPWGLPISAYAFFAITSTGLCLLAAISHLFGGNRLSHLANRMVWLSIITICSAFLAIGLELESPWRMAIYNITSPNLASNIWWMGTLYGLAVGFLLLEFWLILTKHYKIALFLGVLGALAEVAANTCLGGVFSTLAARPYWYGAQLPIYFLGCAFLSGAAATICFTHFAYALRSKKLPEQVSSSMQAAGQVLLLMLVLISVSVFWKITSNYVGGTSAGRTAADALTAGPLATQFWVFEVAIGLAIPILLLVLSRLKSPLIMTISSLMALTGMFFARLNQVVAGQIVYPSFELESAAVYAAYAPSWAEWLIIAAAFGLTGLAFVQGERYFGARFMESSSH